MLGRATTSVCPRAALGRFNALATRAYATAPAGASDVYDGARRPARTPARVR
jgi:hypothetical protein